ncbi:MAG TPA: helix-turn-helix domain-containing protein [Gemmatimonadales bacterium]|nr:helix-turn-helix domain-containing protein [Gemmatimonadales bacterium]
MSRSRAAVLESLHGQPGPTTLAALARATGLHVNTLREHLEALGEQGLVARHRSTPRGRGRPAWRYETTGADEDPARTEYAGLAATLASAIHRTSSRPHEDAVVAGTEWGHELARGRASRPGRGEDRHRRQVVELLDRIGFASETDEDTTIVRLTRCPLLEAAHRYPDVVCGVHLGIVRGALEEYGADPAGTDLVPFAEPGACLLRLARTPDAQ